MRCGFRCVLGFMYIVCARGSYDLHIIVARAPVVAVLQIILGMSEFRFKAKRDECAVCDHCKYYKNRLNMTIDRPHCEETVPASTSPTAYLGIQADVGIHIHRGQGGRRGAVLVAWSSFVFHSPLCYVFIKTVARNRRLGDCFTGYAVILCRTLCYLPQINECDGWGVAGERRMKVKSQCVELN